MAFIEYPRLCFGLTSFRSRRQKIRYPETGNLFNLSKTKISKLVAAVLF